MENATLDKRNDYDWEQIVMTARWAVVIGSEDGKTLELMNPAFARMHGYEVEELKGRPVADIVAPQCQGELKEHIRIVHDRGHHVFETLHVRKDGTVFPVLVDEMTLIDPAGRVRYWVAQVLDISEQKRVEARKDHLNRLLKTVCAINQIILTETDCGRLAQRACDALCGVKGYVACWMVLLNASGKPMDIAHTGLGEGFTRLKAALDAGHLPSCTRKALDSADAVIIRQPTQDCNRCPLVEVFRHHHPCQAMAIRLKHGDKLYGVMNVLIAHEPALNAEEADLLKELSHDIAYGLYGIQRESKRLKAEKALKASEQKFLELFDNTPVGYHELDMQGRITRVNRTELEMLGYREDEMLGHYIWEFMEADIREDSRRAFTEKITGKKPPGKAFERTFLRKDGTRILMLNEDRYLKDKNGRITGLLSTVQDISRYKQLEEEKQHLQTQLLHAQRMESVGRLAGGVAHDFNNLLTTIIGNAELAITELDEGDPVKEHIEEIWKAGQRGAGLARQLLAFSRKQEIQPVVLNLNEIIRELEKLLRRLIGEDIAFQTSLESDLRDVLVDPTQIEQVIVNLAVNARDAMPSGGKLMIDTANVELDDIYFKSHGLSGTSGSYVRMAVSDTGIGMDEAIRSQIFEPFFTTKERDHGTGLGLSTVYGIVKQSNGMIWVYSESGKGTTFKVYFPAAVSDTEAVATEALLPERLMGAETILVVEDEPIVQDVAQRILERYGYRVLAASSGEEAIELLKRHPGKIHMMLTDMVLPGIGGRELAGRIKAFHPELKIIWTSGYADRDFFSDEPKDMVYHFIEKPFRAEDLARKAREVLNQTD
ncbi:MAG: PAS domain S-box protein [Deltaproteobacteria bacterium]|nr:PAS domain S-box protein [Deltaproteobacteria bacterium]